MQLDTGSSDLWIDPAVAGTPFLQNTQNTGVESRICYMYVALVLSLSQGPVLYSPRYELSRSDTTCAIGPILIGNVTFGELTVPEQAFSQYAALLCR